MRDLLKRFTTRQSMGANYSSSGGVGSKSVGTYYATDIHFEVPDNEIWVRFAPGMESKVVFDYLCQDLDNNISQGTTYFNTDANATHLDFSRCTYDPTTNIGAIVFDNTVDRIGPDALNSDTVGNTERFSEIYIPWTVKYIEERAFKSCFRLKTIDLRHTKITEVRDNAFEGCSQLQTAYFPNSLRKFGAGVFANDNELIYLDLGGNNSIIETVRYDMGIDSNISFSDNSDIISFSSYIVSLAGNSKNLTVRCNRRKLPRYQKRVNGSDSTTTISRPSFIHASSSDTLTGNVTVLCPLNRISSFTGCEDNSDGTPWQVTVEPSPDPTIIKSYSIYDGPKVFESCEMYHVKNVDFRSKHFSGRGMSIYRGNGTIDTPFYINSSQRELFEKYSSCSPQVKVYADGYGEFSSFMYITGYQSPMTGNVDHVLVACDNNHLIYHNGKYFSSICFCAKAAPTIKVYLVHLTHRNAVAELTLSTSGSSATATVEDIQSYNV